MRIQLMAESLRILNPERPTQTLKCQSRVRRFTHKSVLIAIERVRRVQQTIEAAGNLAVQVHRTKTDRNNLELCQRIPKSEYSLTELDASADVSNNKEN